MTRRWPWSDRDGDLVAVYLRWIWWRALLHRGWWLVTSVYLVVDAGLTPSQLVTIGVAQALIAFVAEVPAGVVADTVGRKWSLLVSHALMGTAMIATGLTTSFPALIGTQMLWGLAWTFASGADVAWVTDELDQPTRIADVLVRSGRADLMGASVGVVVLGAVGAVVDRTTSMFVAGSAMLLLGLYMWLRFDERRFVATRTRRLRASWSILIAGAMLVRRSRLIVVVVLATVFVNGAGNAGRLLPRRLIDLGLPTDPVAWFTGLALLTLLVGAAALRVVEQHVDGPGRARRGYLLASAAGAAGAIVLAVAPEEIAACAGALLVGGIATPLTRTFATIWVNRETTADVRATVLSMLAQGEYFGEIVCGGGVAFVAAVAGLAPALLACSGLYVISMALVSGGVTGRDAAGVGS